MCLHIHLTPFRREGWMRVLCACECFWWVSVLAHVWAVSLSRRSSSACVCVCLYIPLRNTIPMVSLGVELIFVVLDVRAPCQQQGVRSPGIVRMTPFLSPMSISQAGRHKTTHTVSTQCLSSPTRHRHGYFDRLLV